MDISNVQYQSIYTFVLIELYGLKHTSLYRTDHNCDHHHCGPAQVPLQRNIHPPSNVRA